MKMTIITAIAASGRVFDRAVAPRRNYVIAATDSALLAGVLSRVFLLLNYVYGCLQVSAVSWALFGRKTAARTLTASAAVGLVVLTLDAGRLALLLARRGTPS